MKNEKLRKNSSNGFNAQLKNESMVNLNNNQFI